MELNIFKETQDRELAKTPEYRKVLEVLNNLWQGQVIQRGGGYCLSMSDMIRTLLKKEGIESRLVECKLTVMNKNPPSLMLIGHDGLIQRTGNINEMDVHVVCVTETDIPMLIDASIINLNMGRAWIVERAGHGDVIGEYVYDDVNWIYQIKPYSQLPQSYQKSIVDRIHTDRKIFKKLHWLTVILALVITVSTLNAARGAYDFYMVYVKENNWGPKTLERLDQRLDNLEDLLHIPLEQRVREQQREAPAPESTNQP
jgi:hypothetical protein